MMISFDLWTFSIQFLFIVYFQRGIAHKETAHPLLIISYDGFRWDYLNRTHAPNFELIKKNGVHATKGLKNQFQTSTLTNHWSIVTGLYAESHGVVENAMFDPKINKPYIPLYMDPFAKNDPRYYDVPGVEPIWVSNQLQKEHGRSGSIMWWGAENSVKGIRPTRHVPFRPFEEANDPFGKVDTMIDWFTNHYAINLGLLWFEDLDFAGHYAGPNSQNITDALLLLDNVTGYLLKSLKEKGLLDSMNIIFTADHGMAPVSRDRLIFLEDIINPKHFSIYVHSQPAIGIFPHHADYEQEIYNNLTKASKRLPFKVFWKRDIPEFLHVKHNNRVPSIYVFANINWTFIFNKSKESFEMKGQHGFSSEYEEMHPIFMAMGPSFKKGSSVEQFSIVDLYPLMCHLLWLNPMPNNGSMLIVSQLLKDGHENNLWTFGTYILCLIVIACVGGVFSVGACRQHRYLKRKLKQLGMTNSRAAMLSLSHAQVPLMSVDEDEADEDDF